MQDLRFLLKARYSNSRALVIGINQYKSVPPLSYAVSDAEAIRDLLVHDLKFPEENVLYLTDADATKQAILRSFLSFSSESIDLDERVVIFFAGHGHTKRGIRGEVGYLVPHDGDPQDPSTMIRWDELTRNSELVRAKHLLFIMDACYGGLALTRSLGPGSVRFVKDMLRRFSRQVLTAGKADEVVADSGGPIAGHSVFTGHLIQGLRGAAATEQGVLTANGLMAYVHSKVAHDNNSNQTPHYGYFDGDGDFILSAPQLTDTKDDDKVDVDQLFVVPLVEWGHSTDTTQDKISFAKKLLVGDASAIELHDLMIEEMRHFLSETAEDHFQVQGRWSTEEFLSRLARYEAASSDLCLLLACLSYWARPAHLQILHKVLARSTDRLEMRSGLSVWLSLRWYPMILELYYAGVAAVEAQRYDSLSTILGARARTPKGEERTFSDAVANAMADLYATEAFKQLPGHERHYTPLSDYLFKLLQPKMDDVLFMGKNYESAFDEFEVLLALAVAYSSVQSKRLFWGPVGRFGWKHRHGDSPLNKAVNTARAEGESWAPLRAGLFPGATSAQFLEVAHAYVQDIGKLQWF